MWKHCCSKTNSRPASKYPGICELDTRHRVRSDFVNYPGFTRLDSNTSSTCFNSPRSRCVDVDIASLFEIALSCVLVQIDILLDKFMHLDHDQDGVVLLQDWYDEMVSSCCLCLSSNHNRAQSCPFCPPEYPVHTVQSFCYRIPGH